MNHNKYLDLLFESGGKAKEYLVSFKPGLKAAYEKYKKDKNWNQGNFEYLGWFVDPLLCYSGKQFKVREELNGPWDKGTLYRTTDNNSWAFHKSWLNFGDIPQPSLFDLSEQERA